MKKISEIMIAAIENDEKFFKERNWIRSIYHRKKNKFYIGINDENGHVHVITAISHHQALEKARIKEQAAPKSENIQIPFEIIFPNFFGKIDEPDVLDNTLSAIKLRATKCGPYDYGYYYELLEPDIWVSILQILNFCGIENIIVDKGNSYYFTKVACITGCLKYIDKNEYNPYGSFDIDIPEYLINNEFQLNRWIYKA